MAGAVFVTTQRRNSPVSSNSISQERTCALQWNGFEDAKGHGLYNHGPGRNQMPRHAAVVLKVNTDRAVVDISRCLHLRHDEILR